MLGDEPVRRKVRRIIIHRLHIVSLSGRRPFHDIRGPRQDGGYGPGQAEQGRTHLIGPGRGQDLSRTASEQEGAGPSDRIHTRQVLPLHPLGRDDHELEVAGKVLRPRGRVRIPGPADRDRRHRQTAVLRPVHNVLQQPHVFRIRGHRRPGRGIHVHSGDHDAHPDDVEDRRRIRDAGVYERGPSRIL